MSSNIKNTNAECQILWFKWWLPDDQVTFDDFTDFDSLSSADTYDISDHIDYCSYTKSLGNPAGQFSFRLDNSRDWKDIIKPGQWIMILMTQDGNLSKTEVFDQRSDVRGLREGPRELVDPSKVRCIGYIDRIASNVEVGENGEFIVHYEVSGRDYGVIYQETELYFNYFLYEQTVIESISAFIDGSPTKTVDELVRIVHNMFLAPRQIPGLAQALQDGRRSFLQIGQQWLLPKPLLRLTRQTVAGPTFYGEIKDLLNLDETVLQIPIENPISTLNGNVWNSLKQYSIEPFNELYPELDSDGKMKLNMRGIPWAIDRKGYPSLNFIKSFKDLAEEDGVQIDPVDLISYNLGEDSHNRYNHFLIKLKSTYLNPFSNISYYSNNQSITGKEYPHLIKPSISRHGIRLMHVDIDSFAAAFSKGTEAKGGEPDKPLLLEYCDLLVDYYRNSVFFETGTLNINGKNDIRIGKVLELGDGFQFDPQKLFYIEGYTDEFTVGGQGEAFWTQSINVTRGVEKSVLANISGFGRREKPQTERADFLRDKK